MKTKLVKLKTLTLKMVQRIGAGQMRREDSDEAYIIDLCDQILGTPAKQQYRFPFLVGDTGRTLPIDAYYSKLNLVVEYREKQHTEPVRFFDTKHTVSGVSRGEQRQIYDQRRRDVLKQHGIRLVERSAITRTLD